MDGSQNIFKLTTSIIHSLSPNRALKFSPSDNKQKFDKQGIWILKNGIPKRYSIELGLSDDNKTQIISDEIHEKDKVIVSAMTKGKKKQATGMRRPPI